MTDRSTLGALRSTPTLVALLESADQFGIGSRIADHMGWTPGKVSQMKTGRRRVKPSEAERIAAFLGHPVTDLFQAGMTHRVSPQPTSGDDPYPELSGYPMVLTTQEVAEILRVSDDAIRDRCLNGSIKHITLGNRRRIPRSEVARLLTTE